MDDDRDAICRAVEKRQEKFWRISDAIWSYAELGMEEYRSSGLLADVLEAAGFKVDRGVAGMPTAFLATWSRGSGHPTVGFLGEYDALPMLSQKAGLPKQEALVPGAPGHGCSHNTMCTAQALAVIALKERMEEKGLDGTLKLFGSPAEEILASRPFMVRAGLFRGVDAVLDCHGHDSFQASYAVDGTAMYSFIVAFKGKAAHAGSFPWNGRSAADAVELMHAGTERMREHLPATHRVHWVTREGGEAPNVVPDRASTWYYIRDLDENVEKNFQWAADCAKGAALMTQTSHEIKVIAAAHQRFPNRRLAEAIFENIQRVGKPAYTQAEESFSRAMQSEAGFPVIGMDYPLRLTSPETEPFKGGSSDVGDVTLTAPTATLRFPVRIPGSGSHHWTVVSAAKSSIAHKGLTAGAKVLALSAFDLLTNPKLRGEIREEFAGLTAQRPYRSFLPENTRPPLGMNTELMAKYRPAMEKYYDEP
jgi:aminobenzoyl-glutamate utilization protein B